ncbi:TniB family NTP-binding protein, partial [Sphingomonas sp. CFBP 8760]|uniref:TniB family NTP-binding protein n=1 Tax=Sphingomonas sp. CFBP 8760 TaxID=2775282 RepID=UPI001A915471
MMSDQESPAARMARAAEATGRFNAIRVRHGPQNALVGGLDGFRMQALAIRAARAETGRRIAMPVVRTIAELGVGKTIGAERLEERHRPTDPDDARRPVIIATLDTTGMQISVPQAILRALKKPNPNHAMKPAVAWERAHRALREHDVQLVIFDETNRAARRPSMGEVIGGDLMDMLLDGEAAVAFLGTTEANKVFNRVPALKDRMKAPVVLKALEWYDDDEKAIFVAFLKNMDQAMLDCDLVTEAGVLIST